jgi:[ribosomal protein S5]-alanine N-acetyltransferase
MSTLPRLEVPLTDGDVALRPFTLDDVSSVTAACQDPEISRWTVSIPWPYDEEDARTWISGHDRLWQRGEAAEFAVTAPDNGRLLGSLGLHSLDWDERRSLVGYWVVASERGHGVASRALRLAMGWAFGTLALRTVELVTIMGNVASECVATNGGFRVVQEIPDYRHPLDPDHRHHVKRWQRRESGAGGGRADLS